MHCTTIITRNPQNSIANSLGRFSKVVGTKGCRAFGCSAYFRAQDASLAVLLRFRAQGFTDFPGSSA